MNTEKSRTGSAGAAQTERRDQRRIGNTENTQVAAMNLQVEDAPIKRPEDHVEYRLMRVFSDALRLGHKERFTETLVITPTLAAEMLEHNRKNRRVRNSRVELYAAMMRDGQWGLSPQPIAFARNEDLGDGQHRLLACVDSKVTIKQDVKFGCDAAEFELVDGGAARTGGDILTLSGETFGTMRAAIAAILKGSVSGGGSGVGAKAAADFARSLNQDLLRDACIAGSRMSKICAASSTGVAYYWIATHTHRPSLVPEFFASLTTGENIKGPMLNLRDMLQSRSVVGKDSRNTARMRACMFVFAWNDHHAGRKRVNVKNVDGFSLPRVIP